MSHFHTHSCGVEQHFSTAKKQHSFKVYHTVEKKKLSKESAKWEHCMQGNKCHVSWLRATAHRYSFLIPLISSFHLFSPQLKPERFFPPKDVSHSNLDAIARPPGLCLQFTSVFVFHVVYRSSSRVNISTVRQVTIKKQDKVSRGTKHHKNKATFSYIQTAWPIANHLPATSEKTVS